MGCRGRGDAGVRKREAGGPRARLGNEQIDEVGRRSRRVRVRRLGVVERRHDRLGPSGDRRDVELELRPDRQRCAGERESGIGGRAEEVDGRRIVVERRRAVRLQAGGRRKWSIGSRVHDADEVRLGDAIVPRRVTRSRVDGAGGHLNGDEQQALLVAGLGAGPVVVLQARLQLDAERLVVALLVDVAGEVHVLEADAVDLGPLRGEAGPDDVERLRRRAQHRGFRLVAAGAVDVHAHVDPGDERWDGRQHAAVLPIPVYPVDPGQVVVGVDRHRREDDDERAVRVERRQREGVRLALVQHRPRATGEGAGGGVFVADTVSRAVAVLTAVMRVGRLVGDAGPCRTGEADRAGVRVVGIEEHAELGAVALWAHREHRLARRGGEAEAAEAVGAGTRVQLERGLSLSLQRSSEDAGAAGGRGELSAEAGDQGAALQRADERAVPVAGQWRRERPEYHAVEHGGDAAVVAAAAGERDQVLHRRVVQRARQARLPLGAIALLAVDLERAGEVHRALGVTRQVERTEAGRGRRCR